MVPVMEETRTKRPPSGGAIVIAILLSVGAGFAIHQRLLGGDNPDADMFGLLGATLVLFGLLCFLVGYIDEITGWSLSAVTQPAAQTCAYLGAAFLTVPLGHTLTKPQPREAFEAVFVIWAVVSFLLTAGAAALMLRRWWPNR